LEVATRALWRRCGRDVDSALDITMVLADSFPNYSVCGLPFYVSHEVPEMGDLPHRRAEFGWGRMPGQVVYAALDGRFSACHERGRAAEAVKR
jgi:NADPH-dependent 2,4-dienoyl-CoA reductase/sulfur reductase-like enzyme